MSEPDLPAVDPYRASLRRSRERRATANRRRRRRFRSRGVITGLAVTMALGGGAALAAGGGVSSHHSSGGLLRSGSNGSTVAALQRALGITADGVYGPATRSAVRAYQAQHGLEVDGIAGPQTLGALGLSGASTAAPVSASDSSAPAAGTASSGTLARIAACESSNNPQAISPDGLYRGKYQFTRATWRAVGGHGDPAAAPESEQDRRAAVLLAERGTSPWPRCGR